MRQNLHWTVIWSIFGVGCIATVCSLQWAFQKSTNFAKSDESQKVRYVHEILAIKKDDEKTTYTVLTHSMEVVRFEDIGNDGTLDNAYFPTQLHGWQKVTEPRVGAEWKSQDGQKLFDEVLELAKKQESTE